jgi:hypothetical protein
VVPGAEVLVLVDVVAVVVVLTVVVMVPTVVVTVTVLVEVVVTDIGQVFPRTVAIHEELASGY